jgi:ABC-2 type transport system permease protein
MKAEFIIAKKEIKDYFTSKRFLAIVGVLFLLSAYSIIIGLDDYNTTLAAYKQSVLEVKQSPLYSQIMEDFHKKIADAESRNAQDEVAMWQGLMESTENRPMPSILMIFYYFNQYFIYLGIALAIIIGYDSISKEKEEGTFKALLSHPFYRDSIINGKAIGATIVLLIVLAIVFLITAAILLINNVIPSIDDMGRIFSGYLLAVLFCILFFSLAMLVSTFTKNSNTALTCLLGIALFIFIYSQLSGSIVSLIMGPEPVTLNMQADTNNNLINISAEDSASDSQAYSQETLDYWNKYSILGQVFNIASPLYDYQIVTNSLLTNTVTDQKTYRTIVRGVFDSLSSVLFNIFALIVEIIVAFAALYIKFMRMDVR